MFEPLVCLVNYMLVDNPSKGDSQNLLVLKSYWHNANSLALVADHAYIWVAFHFIHKKNSNMTFYSKSFLVYKEGHFYSKLNHLNNMICKSHDYVANVYERKEDYEK